MRLQPHRPFDYVKGDGVQCVSSDSAGATRAKSWGKRPVAVLLVAAVLLLIVS